MATKEKEVAPSPGVYVDDAPLSGVAPDGGSRLGDQEHLVRFYDDEGALAAAVGGFLLEGLTAGESLLAILTEEHRQALEHHLSSRGVDVQAQCASGRIRFLDAEAVLGSFMRDGDPDRALFRASVGELVRTAGEGRRLRAYGEMVDVLWKRGDRQAALRLEELWNELQDEHSFSLLCAYSVASFYKEPRDLERICAHHSAVQIDAEKRGAAPFAWAPAVPPQHEQLIKEIARREEIESALREALRELRHKEERLVRKEAQLKLITDTLPALVAFVGPDLRYRFANAAYERWFKQPASLVVGRTLGEVLGERALETLRPFIQRALAGENVTFESEVPYRACGRRFVHASFIPQRGGGGELDGYVALVNDISTQKALEAAQIASAERAAQLLAITTAIAKAVTEEEVLRAIVDHVAAATNASTAGLWLLDEARQTARLVRSLHYLDGAERKMTDIPLDRDPSIPIVDAMRTGRAVWLSSQRELLEQYPHLRSLITEGRRYRIACLPLVGAGEIVGGLGLTIDEELEATEEERGFLLLIAGYAGQALERLRLLEQEQRSRVRADDAAARMELLGRASQAFAEPHLDLNEKLDRVVRELGRMFDGCVGISLIDGDTLITSAASHPDPEADEMLRSLAESAPLRLGEGINGLVARSGQSVLIESVDPGSIRAKTAPPYHEFLDRFPVHALVCVPLCVRGAVLGTVTMLRTRAGESYSTADLALLEELADRAATAIENTRLNQENLQARSRAEELYRFAHSVVSAESVDQVLEAALDGIEKTLGTDRAAVLLMDSSGIMRFRAWRKLSGEYRAAVDGHSPWSRDDAEPEPVLVADVRADASLRAYLPLFEREGIGSLAFIPLVNRRRLLGKFMVYYPKPHDYSLQEVEIAIAIANHLASVAARFEALAKLTETVRYNELFAGALAHDLKTPLSAMITAAQLALMWQEGEGDRTAKPLARIVTSGQRMNRMIDQLLDLTRARVGGGFQIQPRDANLAELCRQTIDELDLAFPDWQIDMQTFGNPHGSWDSDRLQQILSNLIANAGQHGDLAAGIQVVLDGRREEEVCVSVHNAGSIPEEILANVFDPFRGTVHRRDRSRGLGLGLYIVSEVVRAHRGRIEVDSEPARGTTFTVYLPRRAEG
jgi:PAS domain S-box-containing protein